MAPSFHLPSALDPSSELITFEDDTPQSQIHLLDIDEYDSPPHATTLTTAEGEVVPTEVELVYGYNSGSGGLDPSAKAFYPSTPNPPSSSSSNKEIGIEVDDQEEVERLFKLEPISYPPSPVQESIDINIQRIVSPSTSLAPTRTNTNTRKEKQQQHNNSYRQRTSASPFTSTTPNFTPETPAQTKRGPVSPYKRRRYGTSSTKTLNVKVVNHHSPPSPAPTLYTRYNTPDLTSGSTANLVSEPLLDSEDPGVYESDEPILFTHPSELAGLFTYQGGYFPFPTQKEHEELGRSNTPLCKEDKEVERLIDFEDFISTHFNSIPKPKPQQKHGKEEEGRGVRDSPVAFIDLQGLLDSPKNSKRASTEEIDLDLELDNQPQEEEEELYTTGKDYKFGLDFDEYDDYEHDHEYDLEPELDKVEGDLVDIDTSIQTDTSWMNNMSNINLVSNGSNGHTQTVQINQTSSSTTSSPGVHNVSPYNLLLSQPSPRSSVAPSLLHPSPPDMLQSEIMQSWISTEPTQESKKIVKKLLQHLTRVINRQFGTYGAKAGEERFQVDVFGSVSWGGETGKSGDLDLVILDRAQLRGYEPSLWRQPPGSEPVSKDSSSGRRTIPQAIADLPRCYHTYDLANCLRRAGMRDVQPVPSASTPIVKFRDSEGKLECDINVNDLGGWYNSSLIFHYCSISPYLLRPMIYILKRWLSAQDLNDASGAKGPATMSSYCLTLMAIAYLQSRGCLPNLQRDINVPATSLASDTTDPDIIWVSWSKPQGVPAHVAFSRTPPKGWESREPDLSVSEAVMGFFAFFSQTYPLPTLAGKEEKRRFDHKKQIVSILQGGITNRILGIGAGRSEDDNQRSQLRLQGLSNEHVESVMNVLRDQRIQEEHKMSKGDRGIQPRNWSERRLVVQDPFLWQKNCAGMISKSGLDRFFECVDRAHRMLQNRGKSATVEELLFNPSPIVPRSPNPSRGRGYRGTPPSYRGSPPSQRGGLNGRMLRN